MRFVAFAAKCTLGNKGVLIGHFIDSSQIILLLHNHLILCRAFW